VGGGAANAAISEFADRPPTPDPSPPRAPRAEGGEKKTNSIFKQHSTFSRHDMPEVCQKLLALSSEGAGNAGRLVRPQPRVYW
jgi:hypothetical protein